MLTVKIIASMGNEQIFEASHVQKEHGGILCQTDNDTVFIGPEGHHYSLDWCGREPSAGHTAPSTATAYVMNRFGATVATYRL